MSSKLKRVPTIKGSKKLIQYNISGIYFLIKDKIIVYIGKAIDITSRVRKHIMENQKDFDEVRYIEIEESELTYEEKYYISLYSPKYNIQYSWNAKRYRKYLGNDLSGLRLRDIVECNAIKHMSKEGIS